MASEELNDQIQLAIVQHGTEKHAAGLEQGEIDRLKAARLTAARLTAPAAEIDPAEHNLAIARGEIPHLSRPALATMVGS